MPEQLDSVMKALDAKRRWTQTGAEYWMGRDIQPILGYAKWDNFEKVIGKAKLACESTSMEPQNHFLDAGKMVKVGSGAEVEKRDYFLSRYACYLIAMNGDAAKPEIGTAQTYFAVQTRRQELQDKLTGDERRLQLRERVRSANKSLASCAKHAGVQRFPVFQHVGYEGLYGMGLPSIKRRKGIRPDEDLLDRAGRTELAANEFRITQTEEKLLRDRINNETSAIATHREVGSAVRNAIHKLGGTMPEDLPAEPSIKLLERKRRVPIKIEHKSDSGAQ